MASIKFRWLIGIFTSIILIFAMSHNVSAIDTVIDVSDYSVSAYYPRVQMDCVIDGISYINQGFCSINTDGGHNLSSIKSNTTIVLKKDDILEFDLLVFNPNVPVNLPSDFLMINYQFDLNYFRLLGFKDVSSNYDSIYTLLDVTDGTITSNSQFYKVIRFSFKIVKDGTVSYGFDTSNPITYPVFTFEGALNLKFINVSRYSPLNSKDKANEEQEQATQDAVDDSADAGNSSSSSAQQGGASLLSVITGFFNVITSAQATNCVFDAPLNTYFGNQRLTVDLCALDLPAGIGSLTSIIAIGILIPFAIHMFNKFINLFRSFQS